MKAWRVHEYGAPAEVLTLDDVDVPEPADGELLVRVAATTLNFNDLDGIHGRYKTVPTPVPYIPGMEVYGTVERGGVRDRRVAGRRPLPASRRWPSVGTPSTRWCRRRWRS